MWGKAYDKTTWRGYKFNYRTKAAAMELEARLDTPITVLQGSYNTGVGASAGTHNGGGAIDIMVWGVDPDLVENKARRIGWAMWHRPTLHAADGTLIWNEHFHGILMADKEMSPEAKDQVDEYLDTPGGDGLAGTNPDPNQYHPVVFFNYRKWLRKRTLASKIKAASRSISRLSRKRRAYQKEFNSISITR